MEASIASSAGSPLAAMVQRAVASRLSNIAVDVQARLRQARPPLSAPSSLNQHISTYSK